MKKQVTAGGFYHHLASKDDLLNETMQIYIFRYYSLVLDKINYQWNNKPLDRPREYGSGSRNGLCHGLYMGLHDKITT
jgi:AcrR family transcriptional regulator